MDSMSQTYNKYKKTFIKCFIYLLIKVSYIYLIILNVSYVNDRKSVRIGVSIVINMGYI